MSSRKTNEAPTSAAIPITAGSDMSETIPYRKLFYGCRVCGIGIMIYRSTEVCQTCYNNNSAWGYDTGTLFAAHDKIPEDQRSSMKLELEHERLKIDFYRKKRTEAGIVEPEITCCKCKKRIPFFNFPMQWISGEDDVFFTHLTCMDCLHEKKKLKCFFCKTYREPDLFPLHSRRAGDYLFCNICKAKKIAEHAEYLALKEETVSDKLCMVWLKKNGILINEDSIEMRRQFILMKRKIAKLKKWRAENEPNYNDVDGKQCDHEKVIKGNRGRRKTGSNNDISGTANV